MAIAVAQLREVAAARMSQADREVLVRLIEYAMCEADRTGELLCAHHLSKALVALKDHAGDDLALFANEMKKRNLS